ncbi:dihydromonapterin reductase [Citrobacter sp. JGM124]|uniref:dihydromonapterin reductase n=1 Tax=Citrobacter sp. JGM124 TaxID=2799789 RepID=UPI001BA45319|nr:dihydromonapterin reductase [Citrobacter sp. JGM124]MBS0847449.1 dihydromonapterin reductase [Citrobacter sp. JGM124]
MTQSPIVLTGGGKRIGLALAQHFIDQQQPLIISYRSYYPAIAQLEQAGVTCLYADFSTDQGIVDFATAVMAITPVLRAVIHNASDWQAEGSAQTLGSTLDKMMQIHVKVPYLLNHQLAPLLSQSGLAGGDIIHLTDYVAERGSDKHIAYAASKAALDNMTRSFARKLAPAVKVNAIAPAMIMFNEHDDAVYRHQALDKSLMKIEPGPGEIISLVEYLLNSRYVTGRTHGVDGGRPLR